MTTERATYHHGDLRDALLSAGIAMAVDGGPGAIVLREATRRAGVSPNAAYRHFADRTALVEAVSAAAQGRVAAAMDAERAAVDAELLPGGISPGELARARLHAVGVAYLRFARDEPGLFRAAFSVPTDLRTAFAHDTAGPAGRSPLQHLSDALDEMVASGILPLERRPAAEILAWSAVHGLAMLVLEGPLRDLDRETAVQVGGRLIAMVEKGL